MELTKRKFWKINEALFASIRSEVSKRLNHQMLFNPSCIKGCLHQTACFQWIHQGQNDS